MWCATPAVVGWPLALCGTPCRAIHRRVWLGQDCVAWHCRCATNSGKFSAAGSALSVSVNATLKTPSKGTASCWAANSIKYSTLGVITSASTGAGISGSLRVVVEPVAEVAAGRLVANSSKYNGSLLHLCSFLPATRLVLVFPTLTPLVLVVLVMFDHF